MQSPPQSATHLTFDMAHFGAVVDKLRWEIQQHHEFGGAVHAAADSGKDPRASIWMAMNAAATGWSLIEWAEHDLIKSGRSDALRLYAGVPAGSQMSVVKPAIRKAHPVVDLCHQLAHAGKHASLSTITPGVSTGAKISVYSEGGVPSLKMMGVVRRETDGRFLGYNLVGNDMSALMLWALDFGRALNLPLQQ